MTWIIAGIEVPCSVRHRLRLDRPAWWGQDQLHRQGVREDAVVAESVSRDGSLCSSDVDRISDCQPCPDRGL